MRIGLVVPAWPSGEAANGIVTYAAELVPALRRLGHEVFVFSFNVANNRDPYTIDLQRYQGKWTLAQRLGAKFQLGNVVVVRQCAAIRAAIKCAIAQHKLDVVEIEESFGWGAQLTDLLPVVVRLHGPWFLNGPLEAPNERASHRLKREQREGTSIKSAQCVTVPSLDVLRKVRERYNLELPRSRVIYNPISAVPADEAWRLEHCDNDQILFVGRFDRLKGGDLVLKAFSELTQSFPRLRLTFVGPDRGLRGHYGISTSLADFLSGFAQTFRSRISVTGQLPHAEVMALRRTHFITIVASQFEIFPYSVLEAMSLGCPIIATAVGGIPELIRHQSNGLLVPSGDVPALVSACRLLLKQKHVAVRLASQAWSDATALYNPSTIATQTIKGYQLAIGSFLGRSE